MKHLALGLAAALAFGSSALAALAPTVVRVECNPAPAHSDVLVRMRIIGGDKMDRIVSVSSPMTAAARVHSMAAGARGHMAMTDVTGSFTVLPHTDMKMGGTTHLMLMDVTSPLAVGEVFPLTLTFQNAPIQTVQVHVVAPRSGAIPSS